MVDVQICTVDLMQESQEHFIIMDIVTTSKLRFMHLCNQVNVACSHPMDALVIAGDIEGVMKECAHEWCHFASVFNHIKKQHGEYKLLNIPPNEHMPVSLAHADLADQTVQDSGMKGIDMTSEDISGKEEDISTWKTADTTTTFSLRAW